MFQCILLHKFNFQERTQYLQVHADNSSRVGQILPQFYQNSQGQIHSRFCFSKLQSIPSLTFFFFFCSGFCHTLKWNSHGFTCVPHPDPPSHLPLPWLLLSSWSRRKLVLGRNLACPGVRRGHPRALISVYLVNGAYPMEMQVEGVEGKPSGCITSTPCSWMAKRHE